MNILLIMCVNYIPCKVTINFTGLSLADGIYNVIATAEVSTTGTILEGLCGDVTLRWSDHFLNFKLEDACEEHSQ